MKKALTLLELNALVRQTLELQMPDEYWVEAELSELREVRGHCYMQLIQKEQNNTPVAQAPAKCWKQTWMLVKNHFERVTGQPMRAGLKVLLCVYAQFHENYGFSWIVTDVDPTYTLGDMARKRLEIINRLKEEGVFDLNKQLTLNMFAQHVAVISSGQAAGYGDFVNQLHNNDYGFWFHTELFPAIMQGEQVEDSIVAALNNIYERVDDFDCVVIIRGGGAVADLSGFDTLRLAENIANFPLPVITGIGHDRDESILDMISHTRVKTPTAAAAFLVAHLKLASERVEKASQRVAANVRGRMEVERMRIARLAQAIPALFSVVKSRQEARIDKLFTTIANKAATALQREHKRLEVLTVKQAMLVERRMSGERHRLQLLEQRVEAQDPAKLLKKGYSITLYEGKAVKDADMLPAGARVVTRVERGTFVSEVVEKKSEPKTDA